jgi:hypothetical protein
MSDIGAWRPRRKPAYAPIGLSKYPGWLRLLCTSGLTLGSIEGVSGKWRQTAVLLSFTARLFTGKWVNVAPMEDFRPPKVVISGLLHI